MFETPSTLQLAEPVHDELLGIECHGIARATLPHTDVVQYADGLRIEAEEVQPPSIWSTALDPVEEGAMALFQQSILEVLTMAFHDEVFACKRACQQTCTGVWATGPAQSLSRGCHISVFEPWQSWPIGWRQGSGRSLMVPVFIGGPQNPVPKL